MALLRISYAPMLPQLAFAAGRGAVRLSAYGVVALLVLVTSPLTLALALLCSPALVATLLCVQLFGDFAARQLSRRSALYHTLASRLHARAFSRLEPRLAEVSELRDCVLPPCVPCLLACLRAGRPLTPCAAVAAQARAV